MRVNNNKKSKPELTVAQQNRIVSYIFDHSTIENNVRRPLFGTFTNTAKAFKDTEGRKINRSTIKRVWDKTFASKSLT